MHFILTTFSYLFRLTLMGFVLRAGVALYTGAWSLSNFSSITENFAAYLYGWHFDLAVAAFIYFIHFSLTLLFRLGKGSQRFLTWLLLLSYTFGIISDALYAAESGRHISYEVHNLLSISSTLPQLFAFYWKGVLLAIVGAFVLSRFLKVTYSASRFFLFRGVTWLFVAIISVALARGFAGIPQDPSWAYKAGGGASGAFIALNGAYGIVWGLLNKKNNRPSIQAPEGLDTSKVFEAWKSQRHPHEPLGHFDGNIIVVFLEGWPGALMKTEENEKAILPFFNSLKKSSLTTELFLAQGKRTTEGIFASLCGLPNPLGQSIMFTEIENKNFPCLPQYLEKKGYSSAFFQGSDQHTSGVGLLVLKTGFQVSYGKTEIPDLALKPQNNWGVFDETLYDFALDKMRALSEPMIIGINTNTTHDSVLPAGVTAAFPGADHLSTIHLADSELEVFYQKLSQFPWKKDWLLVLVADHTSYAMPGIFNQYNIPFLMKYHSLNGSPSPLPAGVLPGVYSQNDIATTLADLTGLNMNPYLGRSLLKNDGTPGASVYHGGTAGWFEADRAVIFSPFSSERRFSCFNWKTDPDFKNSSCEPDDELMYDRGMSFIKESQDELFR